LRQLRLQRRGDVIASLNVGLAAPDIDMDVFEAPASIVASLSPPLTILVSPDDRALAASSHLAGGRLRIGAARVDDPDVQDLTQGGMRVVDISTMPASTDMNHDRFIAFAAHALNARDGGELAGTRKSGIYLLDVADHALAAPFAGISRTMADAR
jgi:esterase/lipase superfamily enzyme